MEIAFLLTKNIEAKLHFAYRNKNMTDYATGKTEWVTLSLQNFSSDARQLSLYIIAKRRKPIMTH